MMSTSKIVCSEEGNQIDRRDVFKRKSSLKTLDGSSSRRLGANSVRFSSVAVRDYSLCIGDNPSVSRGIPLSLGWDYGEENSYEINTFEDDRFGQRRSSEDLKLPSLQRLQVLKSLGYSRGEIKDRTKEVEKVKGQRFATRRRVERAERAKTFLRGTVNCLGSLLPSSCPKNKKPSQSDADEETIGCSLSSNRSDFSGAIYIREE